MRPLKWISKLATHTLQKVAICCLLSPQVYQWWINSPCTPLNELNHVYLVGHREAPTFSGLRCFEDDIKAGKVFLHPLGALIGLALVLTEHQR